MKVLVILLIKFGDLNLKLKLLNLKRKWGTYKPLPSFPVALSVLLSCPLPLLEKCVSLNTV